MCLTTAGVLTNEPTPHHADIVGYVGVVGGEGSIFVSIKGTPTWKHWLVENIFAGQV